MSVQEYIGGTKESEELILDFLSQIDKLKIENKILREALEFYADGKNWHSIQVSPDPNCPGADLIDETIGGETARVALKKLV